jgi:hypothetical protein
VDQEVRTVIQKAKKRIPTVDFIIRETAKTLNLRKAQIRQSFGETLVLFDQKATEIFRAYESEALLELAKGWLEINKQRVIGNVEELEALLKLKDWNAFVEKASKLFQDFGEAVQSFEKDLGNMRKARGGKSFEKVLLRLLKLLGIPAEAPLGKAKEKLRRVDIVVPCADTALDFPDRAVLLTCKRTLRERWKQEVPQIEKNRTAYLITIDPDLSETKADEIQEKGLIAFVRDEIASKFQDKPWIRKLSQLPAELGRKGYGAATTVRPGRRS